MFELIRISIAEAEAKLAEIEKMDESDELEPLDPKIRPVVVALMAHGFPTVASCEGHIGRTLYPWIYFVVKVKGVSKENLSECIQAVREQIKGLSKLLGEFYDSRPLMGSSSRYLNVTTNEFTLSDSADDIITHLMNERQLYSDAPKFPSRLGYHLKCAGSDMLQLMPQEVLQPYEEQILANRQQDMLDFAAFLRSKL